MKRFNEPRRLSLQAWLIALAAAGCMTISSAWAANPTNGQRLYTRHCASCHGDDGRPVTIGTPEFSRRSRTMFQTDRVLMDKIKNGQGTMPAFAGILRDGEILDVIAYTRTLFR